MSPLPQTDERQRPEIKNNSPLQRCKCAEPPASHHRQCCQSRCRNRSAASQCNAINGPEGSRQLSSPRQSDHSTPRFFYFRFVPSRVTLLMAGTAATLTLTGSKNGTLSCKTSVSHCWCWRKELHHEHESHIRDHKGSKMNSPQTQSKELPTYKSLELAPRTSLQALAKQRLSCSVKSAISVVCGLRCSSPRTPPHALPCRYCPQWALSLSLFCLWSFSKDIKMWFCTNCGSSSSRSGTGERGLGHGACQSSEVASCSSLLVRERARRDNNDTVMLLKNVRREMREPQYQKARQPARQSG